MRYLASAYNWHDLIALKHVTTPQARAHLLDMQSFAPELMFRRYLPNPAGDYTCEFKHSYGSAHDKHQGSATLTAAPADRPGWYATVVEDCD